MLVSSQKKIRVSDKNISYLNHTMKNHHRALFEYFKIKHVFCTHKTDAKINSNYFEKSRISWPFSKCYPHHFWIKRVFYTKQLYLLRKNKLPQNLTKHAWCFFIIKEYVMVSGDSRKKILSAVVPWAILLYLKQRAGCSSVVQWPLMMWWTAQSIAFGEPIKLFIQPTSAPQLV